MKTCPICAALVHDTDADRHELWHVTLVAALARMDRRILEADRKAAYALSGAAYVAMETEDA